MSQLSINDLVSLVRAVEQQKGKYIKATLTALEKQALERNGQVDPVTRKAVLDGFNNYTRRIHQLLGYTIED